MATLKNELPRSDNVLFVFYDFETTQYTKVTDSATLHVPNLVCLQQVCTHWDVASHRRGLRTLWQEKTFILGWSYRRFTLISLRTSTVGQQRRGYSANAKAFDSQFILNRAIQLKRKPELILNGIKIVSMKIEHMLIIDSVSYLPMPLRNLPVAFGLSVTKSWYPHYFNTNKNLNYVGPIPDVSYYGVDEVGLSEGGEFITWYEGQRNRVLYNKLSGWRHRLETSLPVILTGVYRDWQYRGFSRILYHCIRV